MDNSQVSTLNKSFTKSEPNLRFLSYKEVHVIEYNQQSGPGHQLIRASSYREVCSPLGDLEKSLNPLLSPDVFKSINNFSNSTFNGSKCEDIPCDTMNVYNNSPMDIDEEESEYDSDLEIYKSPTNNWDGRKLKINVPSVKGVSDTDEESVDSDSKNVSVNNFNDEIVTKSKKLFSTILCDKKATNSRLISAIFCVGAVIATCVSYYGDFGNLNISLTEIEREARLSIVNQDHVIDSVINNLIGIKTDPGFKKVLALTGSTGVGKSFLVNQIKNKYPSQSFMSLNYLVEKQVIEQQKNISFPNNCFILTIDDLRFDNTETVGKYIKKFSRECFLVILLFNIQDTVDGLKHIVRTEHHDAISRYFNDNFSNSETVMFKMLDRNMLENWVKTKFTERGIKLGQHSSFIESLVKHHNVENYGFKGVLQKINLFS